MYTDNSIEEIKNISRLDRLIHPQKDAAWPKFEEQSLFESAVTEASDQIQVAREMAITTALGAMTTACQGLIDIELPTKHKVPASLMLLTVAESGERKTTLHSLFFRRILELQNEAFEQDRETDKQHKHQYLIWKSEKNVLLSIYKSHIKNNEDTDDILERLTEHEEKEPASPRLRKFIYDDTTPQALIQNMNNSSLNACLLTSEANSLFSGHGLKELHHLNTLWSGNSIIVDRVGAQNLILKNARLALALMTQPDVIDRFLAKRGDEARGMGFLARFLVVRPKLMAGNRESKDLSELTHILKFNDHAAKLMKRSSETKEQRQIIKFSANACVEWKKYNAQIEQEMKTNKMYFYYKDHASKLMDNVSRVAGIIHTFENKEGDIDTNTLNYAHELCLRYSNHFITYLAGVPNVIKYANLLVNFFMKKPENGIQLGEEVQDGQRLRRGKEHPFVMSDITKYGSNPLRNKTNREEAVDILMRMGHITNRPYKGYVFHEAIAHEEHEITIKNGIHLTISELPLFDDQVYYQSSGRLFTSRSAHMIKVNPDN